MVWIKFTRPYTVQNAEGRTYLEGELVEVSPASANHFIRRYAALEVQPEHPTTIEDKVEEPLATSPARTRVSTKSRKVADEP